MCIRDRIRPDLEGGLGCERRPQRLVLAVEDNADHAVPLGEVHRGRRVAQFYSDDARVHLGRRPEVIPIYLCHKKKAGFASARKNKKTSKIEAGRGTAGMRVN